MLCSSSFWKKRLRDILFAPQALSGSYKPRSYRFPIPFSKTMGIKSSSRSMR